VTLIGVDVSKSRAVDAPKIHHPMPKYPGMQV